MSESNIIDVPQNRSFGGKTNGFVNKAEKNSETKHLRAYLKGKKYYRDGFYTNTLGEREPNFVLVKEIWN